MKLLVFHRLPENEANTLIGFEHSTILVSSDLTPPTTTTTYNNRYDSHSVSVTHRPPSYQLGHFQRIFSTNKSKAKLLMQERIEYIYIFDESMYQKLDTRYIQLCFLQFCVTRRSSLCLKEPSDLKLNRTRVWKC